MDDKGRLKGSIKLLGAGGEAPGSLVGTEKSSISLFNTMPVDLDMNFAPNLSFTVVVKDTTLRSSSTTLKWQVPWSST